MTAPANAEGAPRPLGPHPGGEPRANPAARWITVLVGAVLIALSAVIARELWMMSADAPFTSWLQKVLNFLGTVTIDAVAVTVGIIVSLVGLWLIITSFIPRARTHVRVNSPASIWVRPVDVARKATSTARAETGGDSIRSKADRKSVNVQVVDDGTGTMQERITSTLNDEFRRLANPPAVSVKLLPNPSAGAQTNAAPAATSTEVQR